MVFSGSMIMALNRCQPIEIFVTKPFSLCLNIIPMKFDEIMCCGYYDMIKFKVFGILRFATDKYIGGKELKNQIMQIISIRSKTAILSFRLENISTTKKKEQKQ